MDLSRLIRDEVHPLVPYAPGMRASEVRDRSGAAEVSKLSSNENPYGPVPSAIAAMQAVLPRLNRYPDGACRSLRAKLAAHLGVSERLIAIGNGSNELLRILAEATLRPGDEVVFAWPSFIVYPMVTQLMGATSVRVPLAKGDVTDLEAMADAITARTRIVFLCNPNNPTGTHFTRSELDEFLSRVPEHVLVVLDEAYFEYVTDPDYPDGMTLADGDRPLAVLRTFSKIYSLAGLRVGYGVMPAALVEAVNKVRDPFNVNTVAQVAAYFSLDKTEEIARRRAVNATERDRLCGALGRLGITHAASQTNFVWVHLDQPTKTFEALLSSGIIVRDFGAAGALRIGIGEPADTDKTIAALDRLFGTGGSSS